MTLLTARAACFIMALAATVRLEAAALEFQPVASMPAAVTALAAGAESDAFALAARGSIAVVSIAPSGEDGVSVLRYARGDEAARAVPLAGKLAGLAVEGDGGACYAVVRVFGKHHALRSVELVRIELRTARASSVATLPVTAGGLAISSDAKTILVAAKDEIRTFSNPAIASGALYRIPGDNVGVFPVEGTSYAVVAQRSRVALVDLSTPQGRDGLEVKEQLAAPAPLRGMLASVGEGGPIAFAEGGQAWRVRIGELAAIPVVLPQAPPEAPPAATSAPPPPPAPELEKSASPATPIPPAETAASHEVPGQPGTVSGLLTGPAAGDVATVTFLGPDNILREALRVVPDGSGRYQASALPAGSYRIVASGKAGRVLICSPPYLSLRVGPNSAVEAPELTVLRAQ